MNKEQVIKEIKSLGFMPSTEDIANYVMAKIEKVINEMTDLNEIACIDELQQQTKG